MTKTNMKQKVEVSAIVIRADGTREDLGILNTNTQNEPTKRRKKKWQTQEK